MRKDRPLRVGITTGDLNGIGLELFIRTFSKSGMETCCTPVLFGSTRSVSYYKKILRTSLSLRGISSPEKAVEGAVNCVNVWRDAVCIEPGKPSSTAGAYALQSLEAATSALLHGQVDVLLTAPIDKHSIQCETFPFPGHTEYLEDRLGGESLMLMISEQIRLALVTGHIPLSEVSHRIDGALVRDKIQIMSRSLTCDFACHKPKIAVLSLNPHAGDQGVIGDQDQKILTPVIQDLFDQGNYVFGPYPADGFFGSATYKHFDGVLALYHDQGLIPFKTLSFGSGVNFTAGLSGIRTSPDHGTAYEWVGKGSAMLDSYQQALFIAIEIYKNRQAQGLQTQASAS